MQLLQKVKPAIRKFRPNMKMKHPFFFLPKKSRFSTIRVPEGCPQRTPFCRRRKVETQSARRAPKLQQRVLLYRHTASGVKVETVLIAEETLWTDIKFVQDVETCSSWYLIWSVFYDVFSCILITAFCWFYKYGIILLHFNVIHTANFLILHSFKNQKYALISIQSITKHNSYQVTIK